MDIGVVLQCTPPASRVVDLARRTQTFGFDYVWTFESHILWEEPYVIYSRILDETRKVKVGPMVTNPATRDLSWADSGITTPADLKGRKVGNWGFGNEYELFAGLAAAGLNPGKDVELVQQQFDMQALLNREIDAAQAMTYNEYAQVLEAVNPDTGEL